MTRIAPLMVLVAVALITACTPDAPAVSSAQEQGGDAGYKSTGTFVCRAGKPWQAAQITQSATIEPGATARISVQAPPGLPSTVSPGQIGVFCKVDGQACVGTSCDGNPPVDFIGKNGEGLVWENMHSDKGDGKMTFTALAHNADKASHQVTIMIDVPVQ